MTIIPTMRNKQGCSRMFGQSIRTYARAAAAIVEMTDSFMTSIDDRILVRHYDKKGQVNLQ
ncbi:MAG: hypothetical protein A4E28_01465 [Methanocella sp. PtaU1.Bin125]|nr:MAG: hypothetical protein A4E28_01465 [Methanocella sp. PtaU1.Bin125]